MIVIYSVLLVLLGFFVTMASERTTKHFMDEAGPEDDYSARSLAWSGLTLVFTGMYFLLVGLGAVKVIQFLL